MNAGKSDHDGYQLRSVMATVYNIASWKPKNKWFKEQEFKGKPKRRQPRTGKEVVAEFDKVFGQFYGR
ncbi:hypothetical protein [Gimesia algae]|uniref:Uncharacterized protein n=1 Tax=Gimesia algae TaxID=2527971 RepID=A0A517VMM3_9PLAN|nr:hypothetical protein [Gimesia algae]QDT94263.1 hypothetical protein Pan161_59580 [Gimesia algae]